MLDTWFSSALWPFATLGWPDDTPELRAFTRPAPRHGPRNHLPLGGPDGDDGLEFAGDIPFRDVFIHVDDPGAAKAARCRRASAPGSTPWKIIDSHGADAIPSSCLR